MHISTLSHRFVPALLLLTAATAHAAYVTPDEALTRALGAALPSALSSSAPLAKLALTVNNTQSRPALYVMETADEFILLPADDCAPALLGYGASFDPDNIPTNMQWWLDEYAAQIEYMAANNINYEPLDVSHPEIPYLVKTTWNQSAPYNNLCPTLNGSRSVTGCVATAMAQVINYHQWPATTGIGSYSYTWQGKTLSFNYGSTAFDWDNMLNSYSSSYNSTQASAVATLMYAAGVSVNMNYSPSESGAVSIRIPGALINHFGFDPSARYVGREYYSADEWDALIYGELAQGRPVIYCGQTSTSGHCFVCDGYRSNGYYHINWGWGGMSDGYFLLSALNPNNQGIGGSSSSSGYNSDQDAVIGIRPLSDDPGQPALALMANGGFQYSDTYHCYWFGTNQYGNCGFFNYSVNDVDITTGVMLENPDGSIDYLTGDDKTLTGLGDNGSMSGAATITAYLPYHLDEGEYKASPVARPLASDDWQSIMIPYGMAQYLTVKVGSNGASTYDGTDPNTLDTPCYTILTPATTNFTSGGTVTVRAAIHNPSGNNVTFYPALMMLDQNGQPVNSIGYYNLSLTSSVANYNLGFNIPQVPDGVYNLTTLNFATSRYASEPVKVYVGVVPTSVSMMPDIATVEVDETMDFVATVLPADAFDTSVTWTSSDDSIATVDTAGTVTGIAEGKVTITATTVNDLTATANVTVKKSTGVRDVDVDVIDSPGEIYDLNGRRLTGDTNTLTPGLYIIKQGPSVSKVVIK